MTNLEKLTYSDITAKNNGTVEQLNEVLKHCFPTAKANASGSMAYYEASSTQKGCWVGFNIREPAGPMGVVIDITQLWEELQALKKPEIWWIRVTEDNKEVLGKWFGSLNLHLDNIVGMYRLPNGNIHKGCILIKNLESETYDFGNEIDFATFLKYTGVEPEKVEKSLEEKISEVKKLIDHRGCLLIQFDVLKDELTEINTKISALLK